MIEKLFENVINQSSTKRISAHYVDGQYESLREHSNLCLKISREYKKDTLKKIVTELGLDFDICLYLFESAIYMHDFGKATPYFQSLKMKSEEVVEFFDYQLSHHSKLSSVFYLDQMLKFLGQKKLGREEQLKYFLLVFVLTQCIAKHHSKLNNLEDFSEEFDAYLFELNKIKEKETLLSYFNYTPDMIERKNFSIKKVKFALTQSNQEFREVLYSSGLIFFSFLTIVDILATKKFAQNFSFEEDLYDDCSTALLEKTYQDSTWNQYIIDYLEDSHKISEINCLRSQFILNIDKHVKSLNGTERLFYLEGLVGIGKTHAAQRFATYMVRHGCEKVFYTVPFLAISNQVEVSNKKIDADAVRLDSLTMIRNEYTHEKIDYSKMVINDQLMNYRNATFTFVRFFNLLFGSSKKAALKRMTLRNSIIILDELQTVDVLLLNQFINQIEIMSKLLNFKLLFMSATLPKIPHTVSLSDAAIFREKTILTRRNNLNFDYYLNNYSHIDVLTDIDCIDERILLQCVTKGKAEELYQEIKDKYPSVYLYTGSTPVEERQEIIEKLNRKSEDGLYVTKQIIVVTTNAIEAGVDISMSKAIVDLTSLDSLEQLSGRVNRNGEFAKDQATIYVINQENANFMSPIKTTYTNSLGVNDLNEIFVAKDYQSYMTKVSLIAKRGKKYTEQKLAIQELAFRDVNKMMQLITVESCYYYHIRDAKSRELKGLYEAYRENLKTNRERYDEFYIKQKEVLIKLQEYRHEIRDYSLKKKFIDEYDTESIVFYESEQTFEENNTEKRED